MLELCKSGQMMAKCRSPLNPANIAARDAQFYDSTRNAQEKNAKRVLHEIVTGLNELFDVKNEGFNSAAATYFESTTCYSSDDFDTTLDSAIEEEQRAILLMDNNLQQSNYEEEGYDTDF